PHPDGLPQAAAYDGEEHAVRVTRHRPAHVSPQLVPRKTLPYRSTGGSVRLADLAVGRAGGDIHRGGAELGWEAAEPAARYGSPDPQGRRSGRPVHHTRVIRRLATLGPWAPQGAGKDHLRRACSLPPHGSAG